MRNIRVAAVQLEHTPGDKQANLGKIRGYVEQAAAQGVRMIAFPECCITGYWHLRHLSREELTALAEPVCEGPSAQALLSLAQDHSMTIGIRLHRTSGSGCLPRWM